MSLALAALVGLALGSIPFGLVLTKAAGLGDVRRIGSGSIGATNVLRTGRKDLAALTVEADGRSHTVRLTDPIEDPAMQRLVRFLQEQAKAQRRSAR